MVCETMGITGIAFAVSEINTTCLVDNPEIILNSFIKTNLTGFHNYWICRYIWRYSTGFTEKCRIFKSLEYLSMLIN